MDCVNVLDGIYYQIVSTGFLILVLAQAFLHFRFIRIAQIRLNVNVFARFIKHVGDVRMHARHMVDIRAADYLVLNPQALIDYFALMASKAAFAISSAVR